MNYAQMRAFDIANGPGIRATLFVSGCTHNCFGCFNQDYQHFKYGKTWSSESENTLFTYLKNPNVKGLTILGGEPMDQTRDTDLADLVKKIKEDLSLNIWIYSGYTFEQIVEDPKKFDILKHCDVLVDGKFVQELKNLKLKFRGSENQRIIDVPKSLATGVVCLLENYN
ncbi:MAG TPA: anaerobic ribonucleoside-triphosphate reductase activating protein [Firmicutes bacterium]|nr:anaerobic ribonucleoside-triphosphate reductase activating protein [Bacillota bacterium]